MNMIQPLPGINLPVDVLQEVILFLGTPIPEVGKVFNEASKGARALFWEERKSYLLNHPAISSFIDEPLRMLPIDRRVQELYVRMTGLNPRERILDISFYEQLGTNLMLTQQRITNHFPEIKNLTLRDYRTFLNDPNNHERFSKVDELDLSGLGLTHLPVEMNCFTGLVVLCLDNNNLQKLPDLSSFEHILSLFLQKNKLKEISIEKLPPNLESIDLGYNQLEILDGAPFPDSLKELGLDHNHLSCLNFTFPPELKEFSANFNQIGSLVRAAFPNSIVELSLRGNKIKNLKLVRFPNQLLKLGLSRNKINTLDGATFPQTLGVLFLHFNELTRVNSRVFPPNLNELNLRNNPLPRTDAVHLRTHQEFINHCGTNIDYLYICLASLVFYQILVKQNLF